MPDLEPEKRVGLQVYDAEAERSAKLTDGFKATRAQLARTERALDGREQTLSRSGLYVSYPNLSKRVGGFGADEQPLRVAAHRNVGCRHG